MDIQNISAICRVREWGVDWFLQTRFFVAVVSAKWQNCCRNRSSIIVRSSNYENSLSNSTVFSSTQSYLRSTESVAGWLVCPRWSVSYNSMGWNSPRISSKQWGARSALGIRNISHTNSLCVLLRLLSLWIFQLIVKKVICRRLRIISIKRLSCCR